METKKHNIENFEKFLREKTDEFRMYPSKRVWYSIYNDMHPGNRLPSISMTVVLIGFLFLVGYLNTTETANRNNAGKQEHQSSVNMVAVSDELLSQNFKTNFPAGELSNEPAAGKAADNADVSSTGSTKTTGSRNSVTNNSTQRNIPAARNSRMATAGRSDISITNGVAEQAPQRTDGNNTTNDHSVALMADIHTAETDKLPANPSSNAANENIVADKNNITSVTDVNDQNIPTERNSATVAVQMKPAELTDPAVTVTPGALSGEKEASLAVSVSTNTTDKPLIKAAAVKTNDQVTLKEKAWMDDFVLHNKRVARKWAGKAGLQAYITPSVVYRNIHNNAIDKQLAGTNSNFNNFNADDVVKHKPSFGVETGLSLQYDISRRIRIKAGFQFNYTRYNVFAYETNHPVAATLTMNSDDNILTYEVFRTSNYTNIYGHYSTKLHNETYQFSLPVGADYKLASISDNVSWYAGATLQPTFVLFARSFVLSTDRRSYIQDPTLLNRFNMNAGFETYFSFNKSGYSLQLGPQYRMQLFSTNTKVYSLEERLQNFGVKFGITKRL
jgi:Outer membrane protein beta-barrel domain